LTKYEPLRYENDNDNENDNFQFSTFKAAIEREKSDACISSSEREQARGAASIFNLKEP
jgi:hypothetical protein